MRARDAFVAALVAVLVGYLMHRIGLSLLSEHLDASAESTLLVHPGPSFGGSDLPKRSIATSYVKTATEHTCKEPIRKCRFGLFSISGVANDGTPIKFILSDHLAGAVYRVVYGDTDFVQPVPIVGASLQTALSFDIRKGGSNEQYNPTEAGCEGLDSFRERSSSKMRVLRAKDNAVFTQTRPAYFKAPGTFLENRDPEGLPIPVLNKTVLSEVIHSKRIEFMGPGEVDYHVRLAIPDKHYASQVEVMACWVPRANANRAMLYHNGEWKAPDDIGKPGPYYVNSLGISRTGGLVVAPDTPDRAMGVMLLDWPRGAICTPPTYNIFRSERTMKWNVVQRFGDPENYTVKIPGAQLSWKFRFVFGTLEEVKAAITKLQVDTPEHGREYAKFKELIKQSAQVTEAATTPAVTEAATTPAATEAATTPAATTPAATTKTTKKKK